MTREKRGDDSDREVVMRDKRMESVQREEKGGGEGRYMRMSWTAAGERVIREEGRDKRIS